MYIWSGYGLVYSRQLPCIRCSLRTGETALLQICPLCTTALASLTHWLSRYICLLLPPLILWSYCSYNPWDVQEDNGKWALSRAWVLWASPEEKPCVDTDSHHLAWWLHEQQCPRRRMACEKWQTQRESCLGDRSPMRPTVQSWWNGSGDKGRRSQVDQIREFCICILVEWSYLFQFMEQTQNIQSYCYYFKLDSSLNLKYRETLTTISSSFLSVGQFKASTHITNTDILIADLYPLGCCCHNLYRPALGYYTGFSFAGLLFLYMFPK